MASIINDLISHLQAGETISANDAIYIKSADGKIYQYDVNDDTQVFAGIAKEAGVLNDYVRVAQTGRVKGFTGLTAGAFVYASTSAAGGFQLAEPADALKVILGIAKSATELVINGGLGIKPGGAGGSGGGLDIFYTEDFASTSASDLQVTGTITVADETVNPIAGAKSIKITQVAGSLGAIVKSKAADLGLVLDINQKDNLISLKGRYKYDGLASEIDFVIYDETNAAELGRLSLVPSEAVKTFRLLANTISTTATLSYYFEVAVENIGAVLEIDNIEGQVNPLPTAESVEEYKFSGADNGGTALTASVTPIDFIEIEDSHGAWNGNSLTAPFKGRYHYTGRTFTTTSTTYYLEVYVDNVFIKYAGQTGVTSATKVFTFDIDVNAGQVIEIRSISSLTLLSSAIQHHLTITAQATSANVVYEGQTSELDIVVEGAGNGGTAITADVTDIDFTEVTDSGGNWNGTQFTVPDDGIYDINGVVFLTASVSIGIEMYTDAASPVRISEGATSANSRLFNASKQFSKGEVISLRSTVGATLSNSTVLHHISITKQAVNPLFSVPVTNEVENKYNFRVSSTGVVSKDDRNIVSTAAWSPTGTLTVTVGAGVFTEAPHGLAIGTGTSNILAYDYTSSTSTSLIFTNVNDAGVAADTNVSIELTKAGADYIDKKGYFLGNLSQPVAYLKDIKSSGTAGGTFTSGAWQSRVLNTLEGSNSWISIDTEGATKTTGTDGTARRFTLEAGTYEIEGSASAYAVNRHKAKLRNITDAIDEIIGSGEFGTTSDNGHAKSDVEGTITLVSAKTFEIQHYCETTTLNTGFGVPSTFAVVEVYAQISIRKLK